MCSGRLRRLERRQERGPTPALRTDVPERRRRLQWRGIRSFLQRIQPHPMVTHTTTRACSMRKRERRQAEAAVLRAWKHSRQKTGRPCVGRKGTVVCFPHPEQVAWVSTFV